MDRSHRRFGEAVVAEQQCKSAIYLVVDIIDAGQSYTLVRVHVSKHNHLNFRDC